MPPSDRRYSSLRLLHGFALQQVANCLFEAGGWGVWPVVADLTATNLTTKIVISPQGDKFRTVQAAAGAIGDAE